MFVLVGLLVWRCFLRACVLCKVLPIACAFLSPVWMYGFHLRMCRNNLISLVLSVWRMKRLRYVVLMKFILLFFFPHCTLPFSSTCLDSLILPSDDKSLHVNKYKPCQIHVRRRLFVVWKWWFLLKHAALSYCRWGFNATCSCRASRHALQFFLCFLRKKELNGLHIWILLLSLIYRQVMKGCK